MELEEHKCNRCFYQHVEGSLKPCAGCTGYEKFLDQRTFLHPPIKDQARHNWTFSGQFGEEVDHETENDWLGDGYDAVEKPKHYMLFEDEGIEVRDVIEKLVGTMDKSCAYSGMFMADYVQLMQYLMRFMDKNGLEDLRKGAWYLNKLIEAYDD